MREILTEYRVPITATLLVVCLASMYVLTSQSASSFPTYLLAVFTLAGVRQWRGLWFDKLFLLCVACSLYLATTGFWSEPFEARGVLSKYTRAVLLLCFVVAVAEGFRVDWFRARMTATLALFGGLAALAAILVFFIEPPEDNRLNGLGQLDTHVRAALVYGVSLVCCISWALDTPSRSMRMVALAAAFALGLAVALSGSRNAWIAVPFGCSVYLAATYLPKRSQFVLVTSGMVLLLLAMVAVLWFVPGTREALLPRGDSFRLLIWSTLLDDAIENGFWFGRGILTPETVTTGDVVLRHAHSLYVAAFFQGGVVGFLLFAGMLAIGLKTLFDHFDEAEAKLALAIMAVALPGYLLDGYEIVDKIGWGWILLWLPLAVCVGLRGRRDLEDATRFSGG